MSSVHKKFIIKALTKSFPSTKRFLKFKKSFYSENKLPQPTNADIRELYEEMVAQKKIKRKPSFEQAMLSRGIRTQSGVAVVAVLTKPYACPGKCAFCPTEENMPKSYLSNEPAVMRAIMNKFNPYKQTQSRLHALMINGHSTNKIELIVMGGTFSYFPKKYQYWFVKECFRACNEFTVSRKSKVESRKSTNLNLPLLKQQLIYEQHRNEKAKTKIVGLTLETRPDWINKKEIDNFRQLGCTRVELGVQSVYDDVLKKNRRGHLTQATITATKLLKNAGFKINYHMMPGLYGSSPAKDFKMFKELFSNQDYQPDMLKIYPTVVIKGTPLYRWWKQGKYQPLSNEVFEKLVIKIKNEAIPPYVRIQRLVRDVPLPSIEAGPTVSNLRQIIAPKAHCQCIRCREIKGDYKTQEKQQGGRSSRRSEVTNDGRGGISLLRSDIQSFNKQFPSGLILNRIDYPASDGKEIFLQFIDDNNRLYALLRLRINQDSASQLSALDSQLSTPAIIREVHTYGKVVPVGKKSKVYHKGIHKINGKDREDALGYKNSPQHIGLGRQLLKEAEKIAQKELTELGIPSDEQKIAVISGVGVRDYYRKNGYRLQDTYMMKKL